MPHITTLDLTLRPKVATTITVARANSLGPYLQGALMELVDPGYAALLHRLQFNPYSQHCLRGEGDTLVWRIATLTDEAYDQLILPAKRIDTLELRALGWQLTVAKSEERRQDLRAITDRIATPGPEKVRVRFLTPTAFKSGGSYVFLPSVRLTFQNLLMHYSYVYEGSAEVDEEMLAFVEQHVRITSFNIRSQYFDHAMGKGRKLPAFVGTVGLFLRGPQQLNGLCRMLLSFGEAAGVGIKTSMGMGGMQCMM